MKTYYPSVPKNQAYPTWTLCGFCQHSVPDFRGHGCTWSRHSQPVEGWIATPVRRRFGKNEVTAYCVHECPQFLEEPPRPNTGEGVE